MKTDYTKTNDEWIEAGDYFNYPECLVSRVRVKHLCYIPII